jgi:putative transposase
MNRRPHCAPVGTDGVQITVPLLLKTSPEQAAILAASLLACNRAAQAAAVWMLANGRPGKYEAQASIYQSLKEEFGVDAQPALRALGKAADIVKKLPKAATAVCVREDGAFPYDRGPMFSFPGGKLSLWTTAGRLKGVAFSCEPAKLPLVESGKHRQSDLRTDRQGRWWLDLVVDLTDPPETEPAGFLGVDLGLANLAVTSTGEVIGDDRLERLRKKRARVRRSLQKRNTHKARRKLARTAGRQARWQRQESHRVAKRVVEAAKAQSLAVAMEDLKGLHAKPGKRTASRELRARLGNWPFALIRAFVSYKAKRAGVKVVLVSPAYTSQTCSRCGHCEEANRLSRDLFRCVACGHESCADLNAARNIAAAAATSEHGGVRKPSRRPVCRKAE